VQNAHDTKALGTLLADSPKLLWITRGTAVWGRDAALERFAKRHHRTWRLEPDPTSIRVVPLSDSATQLHAIDQFTIGAPNQPPQVTRYFLNQVLVKPDGAWRVMSIFPVPALGTSSRSFRRCFPATKSRSRNWNRAPWRHRHCARCHRATERSR